MANNLTNMSNNCDAESTSGPHFQGLADSTDSAAWHDVEESFTVDQDGQSAVGLGTDPIWDS
jgi:hypothetical protein